MSQTMRDRLIAAAENRANYQVRLGDCEEVVDNWDQIVDAILAELSGEGSGMLRAGGEAVQAHLGQDDSGEFAAPADCALIAALAFDAMIDHVRSGK